MIFNSNIPQSSGGTASFVALDFNPLPKMLCKQTTEGFHNFIVPRYYIFSTFDSLLSYRFPIFPFPKDIDLKGNAEMNIIYTFRKN